MKLMIIPCSNSKGEYYTIVNPQNNFHVHAMNRKEVNRIIKAFNSINVGAPVREARFIKMKAVRLCFGGKVLCQF